jgi:hypothetical protein
MKVSLKVALGKAVRDHSENLLERGYVNDKKLLRYNDIVWTYRVIKLCGGPKVAETLDKELLHDLVEMCFKNGVNYSGESVKTWAWLWAIPTIPNEKAFLK